MGSEDGINRPQALARQTGGRTVAKRIAIHAGALLLTLVSWAVIVVIFVVVLAGMSTGRRWDAGCGELTSSELRNYRIAAFATALLIPLVPAVVGVCMRRLNMVAWPWFALAAVATVYAVTVGLHAQPTDWCFTF
jgi:hypothetical protein